MALNIHLYVFTHTYICFLEVSGGGGHHGDELLHLLSNGWFGLIWSLTSTEPPQLDAGVEVNGEQRKHKLTRSQEVQPDAEGHLVGRS